MKMTQLDRIEWLLRQVLHSHTSNSDAEIDELMELEWRSREYRLSVERLKRDDERAERIKAR